MKKSDPRALCFECLLRIWNCDYIGEFCVDELQKKKAECIKQHIWQLCLVIVELEFLKAYHRSLNDPHRHLLLALNPKPQLRIYSGNKCLQAQTDYGVDFDVCKAAMKALAKKKQEACDTVMAFLSWGLGQ